MYTLSFEDINIGSRRASVCVSISKVYKSHGKAQTGCHLTIVNDTYRRRGPLSPLAPLNQFSNPCVYRIRQLRRSYGIMCLSHVAVFSANMVLFVINWHASFNIIKANAKFAILCISIGAGVRILFERRVGPKPHKISTYLWAMHANFSELCNFLFFHTRAQSNDISSARRIASNHSSRAVVSALSLYFLARTYLAHVQSLFIR